MGKKARSSGHRTTSIDVVETIYANLERRDPDAWLRESLASITACAGEGLGGLAHRYAAAAHPSQWRLSGAVVHDAPETLVNIASDTLGLSSPEDLARWYRVAGSAGTFSSLTGMSQEDLPSAAGGIAARAGVGDQLYINAADVDDRGVVVLLNLRDRRGLALAERRRLEMLAAHLTAAERLMTRLKAHREPAVIFDTDGRAAHVATGHEAMLSPLRRWLVTIERARGRARRLDPDAALASWCALLEGRYTLLDRFESDGRRYVVAHPNAPRARDPRGLTSSEAVVAAWAARGHSDKLIAYELGMSPGTVSGLLARVFRKLGVDSRTAMAQRLATPRHVSTLRIDGGDELLVFSDDCLGDDALEEAWLALLTTAERAIAVGIARGLRNQDVAKARGVSVRTVEAQLTTIYKKLGVRSRAELVAHVVARRPRR